MKVIAYQRDWRVCVRV